MSLATAKQALGAAVREMGGQVRSGQETMLEEICSALEAPEHLLVQAGTGTGKSLGYLIPLMDFAVSREERVLVSTATLNLQHQILTKDAPVAAQAIEDVHGRRPRVALLKDGITICAPFDLAADTPWKERSLMSRPSAMMMTRPRRPVSWARRLCVYVAGPRKRKRGIEMNSTPG